MILTTKRVAIPLGVLILAYFLSQVFSGRIILPQFFSLGPLVIHYYGIIIALAAGAGFYLAIKRSLTYKLERQQAENILFWTIIGGFIGARLYHVLSSADFYWQHPSEILKVWNGGLSIYGAVIGGIIAATLVSRVILDTLDWLAPSVILGQIIGRLGNLFNYEAYGYPTNLPWKMFVPTNFRPENFQSHNFFHPWFLYEALGNAIILIFLLKFFKPKAKGEVVFLYLLLYNSLRFCLEFLRIDSTFIYGFRLNAAVSLTLTLFGFAGLVICKKQYSKIIN